MRRARKLLKMLCMMLGVLLLAGSAGQQVHATAINNITVYVDCNGGTYLTVGHPDMNNFDAEFVVPQGASISAADHTIIGDSPTAIGKDFLGWNVYGASGNMVGSLWSADQVNSYTITETTRFVAQWKDRDPAYTAKDIYFLLWDHNKDAVDYTAKVSVIYDGVKYGGYGFVRISEDICSTWKGNFEVILEGNGHYTRENRKWVEYSTSLFSLRDFRHMNNVSYQMSETPAGSDTSPVRKSINEFIYSVRDVEPTITVLNSLSTQVAPVAIDTSASTLPADMIVRAEKYVSGTQLEEVATLIANIAGGDTKAVYDIEIADGSGNGIHHTGAKVKVDIDLPADYQVPEDKQVVVYYVSEDGKLEACTTTLHKKDDGTPYVTFETDHFSVYAVAEVEKPKPAQEPTQESIAEPSKAPAEADAQEPGVNSATEEESIGSGENLSQKEGVQETAMEEEQEVAGEAGVIGNGSNFTVIWIWIGALVVVILVAVCVVVVRKKK
ncbi:MAG: hypothetical protein IJ335_10595 [Lachnospiraceae bacterium]|nr:hypothetical protein [Lachnospiraceae bacterium]